MKKRYICVIGGLMILGTLAGGGKDAQPAKSADNAVVESAAPVQPIEVTARELEAAYAANEAGAQIKYGEKPLLVTAVIRSIDLDFADKPFLVLAGAEMFGGPQAALTETSQALAPSLAKGQKIVLQCSGVGEVVGTPMLKDCEIQR